MTVDQGEPHGPYQDQSKHDGDDVSPEGQLPSLHHQGNKHRGGDKQGGGQVDGKLVERHDGQTGNRLDASVPDVVKTLTAEIKVFTAGL